MDFASEYILENTSVDDSGDDYLLVNPSVQTERPPLPAPPSSSWDSDSDSDCVENYECAIMDFDEAEETPPAPHQQQQQQPPPSSLSSNTVKFPMKKLIQEPAERTLPRSQKIQCSCGAILSHIDRPANEDGKTFWHCKFCGKKQEVEKWPDLDGDQQDVLYMDEAAQAEQPFLLENIPSQEAPVVIFVIDTSGSMSSPVKGTSGGRLNPTRLSPLLNEIIDTDRAIALSMIPQEFMPQVVDTTVECVNRIQTVKEGLITQLRNMNLEQRVGLISFSSAVNIHGDCSSECQVIWADHCERLGFDDLVAKGEMQGQLRPLSETRENMEAVIKGLKDEGQTSLGPALTVAVAMAKNVKGSKVIVCTDGVATSGLGNPEFGDEAVNKFYDDLSWNCKIDGVSVSIVCFDDCGMGTQFGALPKETGGQVEKITENHENFGRALESDLRLQTFATNVQTRFSVCQDMYIDEGKEKDKESSVINVLGNISLSTNPSYSFAFRDASETQHTEGEPMSLSTFDVVSPAEARSTTATDSVREATPFTEQQSHKSSETEGQGQSSGAQGQMNGAQELHHGAQGQTTGGAQGQMNGAQGGAPMEQGEIAAKESPFQYEVTFTTLSGQTGTRVWTILKPVTNSVKKAVEKSNPETMVSNTLQECSKEILQDPKNKGNLIEKCQMAARKCDDLKRLPDIQGNGGLLKQISDFRGTAMKVARNQNLDEDSATEFRKREKGQL